MIPIPVASVMFLTGPDDPLPREFVVQSSAYQDVAFCFDGEKPGWVIAWVNGQAWLENFSLGPERSHFLGTDPAEAMRRAIQIIAAWTLPGTGKPN